jgi:hypothetical protein
LWIDKDRWNESVDRRGKRLIRRGKVFAVRVGAWHTNPELVALGIGNGAGTQFAGITLEREQAIEVAKALFEFAGFKPYSDEDEF